MKDGSNPINLTEKLAARKRSDANGDGEEKPPVAQFLVSVYETGDYDKVTVVIEATNHALIDAVFACAYFMWTTAEKSKLDPDEALSMLCREAKEYENKVIHIGGDS